MSVSPWRPFPPSGDTVGTDFPADLDKVWVRMREWTRRPFLAKWHDDGHSTAYANPEPLGSAELTNFSVPWYELDAWHPM